MELINDIKKDKRVALARSTKMSLTSLALAEDTDLKKFIEAELEAMGKQGVGYRALLTQYETTAQKLREVTK